MIISNDYAVYTANNYSSLKGVRAYQEGCFGGGPSWGFVTEFVKVLEVSTKGEVLVSIAVGFCSKHWHFDDYVYYLRVLKRSSLRRVCCLDVC